MFPVFGISWGHKIYVMRAGTAHRLLLQQKKKGRSTGRRCVGVGQK
jgi:hypothetical protein